MEVYDVDEYDDVCSAYVDAKNKMNQMRTARGFFPVVAMIGGGGGSYGKKDGRKGSGKKFKGRPKGPGPRGGKGKQMPKPGPSSPSGKARGRVLGNNYAFDVANLDIGHGTVLRVATARSGSGSMTMPRTSTWSRTWMPRDGGAGALLGSRHQVEVYPCTKGFRYGDSQMEATKTCVWEETQDAGLRHWWNSPHPGWIEKMGIAVDYGKNMMRWPDREWRAVKVGPKGEHSLHLAEDIKELKDAEVAGYLIPEGAEGHVDFKSNLGVQALLVAEDDNLEESYAVEPGTVPMDMDDVVDEGVSKEPSQQNAVGLDAGGIEDP